jgi:hypothetical protein
LTSKKTENFETWKLKWKNFLISSNINSINRAAVKEEHAKAALTAAPSNDTLKWLNGQGFDPDKLRKAEFIILKIEEYIQGTTNPYIQFVELIGREKSSNERFNHFVTDVCKRVKRCTHNKVTNLMDWFTTMIAVTNHDNVKVRKKLLLEKDLKLDTAKAICKEEEKAAKMHAWSKAKQAHLKLRQVIQHQVSHRTNQVVDANSIMAVEHHGEA